jgi:hypothetical protein
MIPRFYPRGEYRHGMCLTGRRRDSEAMSELNAHKTSTGGSWTDQVVRRQSFEADNPGVTIAFTREPWAWTATWQVDGHKTVVTEHDLRHLLDRLDRTTSAQELAR